MTGGAVQASEAIAKTFTVTAYYSPLPNQLFYLTGNYQRELKLNGSGVRGADYTPVYSGMLAAPKKYAFGTKIYLEGFGVGTVHDRGGAIVPQGQRSNAHDRIDIWVGYGDAGLRRALQWGRRNVNAYLYPADSQRADSIIIANLPQTSIARLKQILSKNYSSSSSGRKATTGHYLSKLLPRGLGLGDKNQAVGNLQTVLHNLGYLKVKPTNYFGNQTTAALRQFQLEYQVIASADAYGNGHFGPRTQAQLIKILERRQSSLNKQRALIAEIPASNNPVNQLVASSQSEIIAKISAW